jgi:hypothetical protein
MNKSIVLFLLFVVITVVSFAQDEKTRVFGIKAGANLSMFSATYHSKQSLKPGFTAGVFMRSRRSDAIHLRTELYFSSQGEKTEYVYGSQSLGKTETTINAINLPVLFEFGRTVAFQIGPQVGLLLSGNEKGSTASGSKVNDDLKEIMKPVDIGIVVGLGFYDGEHLSFGARYNFGISPVFEKQDGQPSDYPTFANRVIHLYAGFSF